MVDYLGLGGTFFIGSPKQPTITVCSLADDRYEMVKFRGSDRLVSSIFPNLEVTAEQILAMGRE